MTLADLCSHSELTSRCICLLSFRPMGMVVWTGGGGSHDGGLLQSDPAASHGTDEAKEQRD